VLDASWPEYFPINIAELTVASRSLDPLDEAEVGFIGEAVADALGGDFWRIAEADVEPEPEPVMQPRPTVWQGMHLRS
jgi:hypothetical protein